MRHDSSVQPSMESKATQWQGGFDFFAVFWGLAIPFLLFVKHNDYSYFQLEILICLAGLVILGLICSVLIHLSGWVMRGFVIVGLLTIFTDIQSDWFRSVETRYLAFFLMTICSAGVLFLSWLMRANLARVVAVVFFVMLIPLLLTPRSPQPKVVVHVNKNQPVADKALPVVVHLILDEQLGIEGFPGQFPFNLKLKTNLKSFYQSNGFRLFGKAYSRYVDTMESIANLVNYTEDRTSQHFFDSMVSRTRVLMRNAYFRGMANRGYSIRVYQSTYIDYCQQSDVELASCATYPMASIKSIESLSLGVLSKSWVITSMFARLSYLYDRLRVKYEEKLRVIFAKRDWLLPMWEWERSRIGPIPVLSVLEHLRVDVATAPPGTMFFAHLLMPHYPYVYDAHCQLKPVKDWMNSSDPTAVWPYSNTPASREKRYAAYGEQVTCLHVKLQTLFDTMRSAGIFDRAVIIIHGDHGSRIRLTADHQATVLWTEDDYVDSFSALFAIKSPMYEPGYDLRPLPINELVGEAVRPNARLDQVDWSAPYVLMRLPGDTELVSRPLVRFSTETR